MQYSLFRFTLHVRMVALALVELCSRCDPFAPLPLCVGLIVYHGTSVYSDVFAVTGVSYSR